MAGYLRLVCDAWRREVTDKRGVPGGVTFEQTGKISARACSWQGGSARGVLTVGTRT